MAPRPTDVRVLPTPQETAEAAARLVVTIAAERVRQEGRFTIALSGGNTPRRLYHALAVPPLRNGVAWTRWQVFWGDERCVPPDHPDSNYGMARTALLDHVPIPSNQVHRMRGEVLPPTVGADEYERELQTVFPSMPPVFDLILLGMGSDGHVASLMPGTAALVERERSVAANWAPQLARHRLTLTLPVINAARHIVMLVTGQAKAQAVMRTLGDAAPSDETPASLVAPANGTLTWFLDAKAASLLPVDSGSRTTS